MEVDYKIHIEEGIRLFENGQSEDAISTISKALVLEGHSPEPYALLGDINFMIVKPLESLRNYKTAFELDPTNLQLIEMIQSVTNIINNNPNGIEYSSKILELDPNNEIINYRLFCNTKDKKYIETLKKSKSPLEKVALSHNMFLYKQLRSILGYIKEEENKRIKYIKPTKKYIVKEINGYKRIVKPTDCYNHTLDELYKIAVYKTMEENPSSSSIFKLAKKQQQNNINGDVRFYEYIIISLWSTVCKKELLEYLDKFLYFRQDSGGMALAILTGQLLLETNQIKESANVFGSFGESFILNPDKSVEFILQRHKLSIYALTSFYTYIQLYDLNKVKFTSLFTDYKDKQLAQYTHFDPTDILQLLSALELYEKYLDKYNQLADQEISSARTHEIDQLREFVETRCDVITWSIKACQDIIFIDQNIHYGKLIINPTDFNKEYMFDILKLCYSQLYNENKIVEVWH